MRLSGISILLAAGVLAATAAVSGDPAALRPVVGALRGLDAKEVPAMLVGGAARWSLTANARDLPGVRDCLERDLAIVPPEIRPHIGRILELSRPAPR